jgi:hypothetical protein
MRASFTASILLGTAVSVAGCLGDYQMQDPATPPPQDDGNGNNGNGNGVGGGDDAGVGGGTVDVKADFVANVAPILVGSDGKTGACGACHAVASGGAGPSFLVPNPDLFTTVTTYPGLIDSSPAASLLYNKGQHEGPALDASQAPVVGAWIIEYAQYKASLPTDGGVVAPTVTPFVPVMGANTIDLSVLDAKLAGQSISFTAKMVGTTAIELTQLSIKTAATLGMHVVHPLWVTWDDKGNAAPDPSDSFSNLDQSIPGNMTAAMGPGTLLLTGYTAGQKLNVVFKLIEGKVITAGAPAGCKSVANFTTNVKPLLQANCNTCHVGANPTAGLSFDFTASTDAVICANALTEINTTTPANSLLLMRPNPAVNDMHPKKITNYAAYQTAVTNWINLEK